MHCKKCGAGMEEGSAFCSACGAKNKKHKKPFFLVRFFLQTVCLVLFMALLVGLAGTILLADVRMLTSSGGIETILTHLVTAQQVPSAPVPTEPAMGSSYLQRLSATTVSDEYVVDEYGNIIDPNGNIIGNINDLDNVQLPDGVTLPEDITVPSDALTDANSLADYVYDLAKQFLGEDVSITPEQILTFITESNVMEFVAKKTATVVENILSGGTDTAPIITADDITQLVEDNQALIEDTFQVTITPEMKEQIQFQSQEMLNDGQINQVIRNSVDQVLAEPVPGMEDTTVSDLIAQVNVYTQVKFICLAAAVCLVLMALLMALNYYNLPGGLNWNASACVAAGLLLSAPLLLLHITPALLEGILPQTAETLALIDGAAQVISPLHYGLLIFGLALAVASLVWRKLARHI